MNLEVLVSTMNQNDIGLVKKMNIKSDVTIINQTNYDDEFSSLFEYGNIRKISKNEKGLSKSRNVALSVSKADICVIADDDLIYNDNYKSKIISAYKKHPNADIIAFSVPSTNPKRPTSNLREGKISYLNSMKISSFQITFLKSSIEKANLRFNELFGAGSKYTCGEENILLFEALKKGLKIYYVDQEIAKVNHDESTWFNGMNEKYFITKGAMFYNMSQKLSYLFILQFAIRKYPQYKSNMNIINAIELMLTGLKEYKEAHFSQ